MADPALVELGAAALAARIASREVSCVEVVAAHLDRIDELNPRVNAIVARRDRGEVLAEAAERDRALDHGGPAGPLHGMPMAIKDLAEVAGQRWTAGSPAFRDRVDAVDDSFVARVRAAGAFPVKSACRVGRSAAARRARRALRRESCRRVRRQGRSAG